MTFELGQAVVYHEGKDADGNPVSIDELVDGRTYYVITGINEFDLQGDNRFIEHQVIQLAETEMEARAGVNIGFSLDPADVAATGFRLEAKHVLDSGWSNGIGILSGLKAEDKASAEAGVEDEEEEGGNGQDQGKGDFSLAPEGSIFDTIVGKLAQPVTKAIGSGVQALPLKAAGAFAFSYADHDARHDRRAAPPRCSNPTRTSRSRPRSSTRSSSLPRAASRPKRRRAAGPAAAPRQPRRPPPAVRAGPAAQASGSASRPTSGSSIPLPRPPCTMAPNSTRCAMRVISLVQHPYLTSPDEIFPSTLGEFVSSLEREGPEAVSKYLGTTLGLKEALMNSWARPRPSRTRSPLPAWSMC